MRFIAFKSYANEELNNMSSQSLNPRKMIKKNLYFRWGKIIKSGAEL